jgi:hypothetical protein
MGLGKANRMCNLFFAFVIWSDAERFCEHEHFCNNTLEFILQTDTNLIHLFLIHIQV